ncbi:MAG: VOC family protein [Acidimicrobiia bacterium]
MDDQPVLDQVNLVVRDMDAMLDFYRRLGVGVSPTVPPWDRHHRTLSCGDVIDFDLDSTSFASRWDEGWPRGRTGAVLGFRVRERTTVDALYAELTGAGHEGQQPPYDAFWGARYAVVVDPEGNAVGIMSAIDPERRSPPPEPA